MSMAMAEAERFLLLARNQFRSGNLEIGSQPRKDRAACDQSSGNFIMQPRLRPSAPQWAMGVVAQGLADCRPSA